MQLIVPKRTVADTGSFPVEPDGVARWLATLRPLDSENDARELYRGLKHSNRLHNDVQQRRSVISCFIPVLRNLHTHLNEISNAQPLPLTREFLRNALLRDALLREEAFAFKILLADSKTPLADDARRAMQALARQAEAVVHNYRPLPDSLIEDAHQLYALAEEHNLLSTQQDAQLLSLQDHYRFILLLSIADLSQQRARQLPLVADFLRECVSDIHLERRRTAQSIATTDYAIDLRQGSRPEPALSLLSHQPDDVRWFSVAPVLYRVRDVSRQIKTGTTSVPGSDSLERQSLTRLAMALTRSRHRRLARCISYIPSQVVIGHKEICAHLLYPTAMPGEHESALNSPYEPPHELAHGQTHESPWVIVNQTLNGVCLHISGGRAGTIQVGELVSIKEGLSTPVANSDDPGPKVEAMMGVIRWIRSNNTQELVVGVEFLARSVLPVHVTRDGRENEDSLPIEEQDRQVGENALIIACKIQNTVLQTVLLPSYLYQDGDRLIATQGRRTRRFVLRQCLQSNGLFSQFALADG